MFRIQFFTIGLLVSLMTLGQNNVGIGTTSPDASAALEIESSAKGLLLPRLTTTERNNINSPANGLMIYNETNKAFEYFDGSAWKSIDFIDHTAKENLQLNDNWLSNDGGNEGIRITDDGRVAIAKATPENIFDVNLDVEGDIQSSDMILYSNEPEILFRDAGVNNSFTERRAIIAASLNSSNIGGPETNKLEFYVSNGTGQNVVKVLSLLGDQSIITEGDIEVNGNTDMNGDADISGDLNVLGSVSMKKNIVYVEDWSTTTGLQPSPTTYRNVTGVTPWMDVQNGDVLKIHFNLGFRFTQGSGTDPVTFRVQVEKRNGCSTTSYSEEFFYQHDEDGNHHDNWNPISYMDIWPVGCTGQMRFRIQAICTGDDNFEVRDRSLVVTKY